MDNRTLEHILACPSLPSLPAVALRVIELTSDRNVKLPELAATIQNDQGLAAKILKTVNSSFYGLRTPCATINKALVMLGLGPVKALALGFSLVSAVEQKKDAFDYEAYWRRGLFTAVAAKTIAEAGKKRFADEAFLAGLLQDLGVMAFYRALGADYLRVMDRTGGDHSKLAKHELAEFDVQHADIGAMLAQRWKLPEELVMPVRYHERPTAAPVEYADICRCVALGNIVHDVMTDADARDALNRLYSRCEQWFQLDGTAVDSIVKRSRDGARELSQLFKLSTGQFADADAVLNKARQQREQVIATDADAAAIAEADVEGSDAALSSLVSGGGDLDPLTGALSRAAFDSAAHEVHQAGAGAGGTTVVAQFAVDGYKRLCSEHGQEAGDEAVVATASSLIRAFGNLGGKVCRLTVDVFAVVVPKVDGAELARLIGECQKEVARAASGATLSVGWAAGGGNLPAATLVDLVVGATRSLQAAKAGGGGKVLVAPLKAAA